MTYVFSFEIFYIFRKGFDGPAVDVYEVEDRFKSRRLTSAVCADECSDHSFWDVHRYIEFKIAILFLYFIEFDHM